VYQPTIVTRDVESVSKLAHSKMDAHCLGLGQAR
jgi:hypothetical protein